MTTPEQRRPLEDRAADRGHGPAEVPRPEHPRPDFWRPDWLNLNGLWDFEIDAGDSGLERGLVTAPLSGRILVPFAPESSRSGVGNTDFLNAVWYRRTVTVPPEWAGKRLLLHFGAVDYDTTVWVDGAEIGRHRGGFASFSLEVPRDAGAEFALTVRARDLRDAVQARGKQATWYANTHCHYTRTTGIWQTVWLEAVGDTHISGFRLTPHLDEARIDLVATVDAGRRGDVLVARLHDDTATLDTARVAIGNDLALSSALSVPAAHVRPWSVSDPHLYDVTIAIERDEFEIDRVETYTGLRSLAIDGDALLINGEHVFQRLVLDQGYWPDSLMTAPTDDELISDIRRARDVGFNGARLHQKVFESRYLYHADRLGFLVWGEFGDWGVSGQGPAGDNQRPTAAFVAEWLEVLRRDVNHPSIIGWCPLNETHQLKHDRTTDLDDVTLAMFLSTKLVDASRPVIDASGYSHRVPMTDVYDSHSYEQDPDSFAAEQAGLAQGTPFVNRHPDGDYSVPYAGQPFFISEFGGIWWDPDSDASGEDREKSWGYGQRVRSVTEFYERFSALVGVLTSDPHMFGYCYTQLTDVFQETNGLYTYDRRLKFDAITLRAIQSEPPAYTSRSRTAGTVRPRRLSPVPQPDPGTAA